MRVCKYLNIFLRIFEVIFNSFQFFSILFIQSSKDELLLILQLVRDRSRRVREMAQRRTGLIRRGKVRFSWSKAQIIETLAFLGRLLSVEHNLEALLKKRQ